MGQPLEYLEVLMTGNDSPCHGEAYVRVFNGEAPDTVRRSDNLLMFTEWMNGFLRTHPGDYQTMTEKVRSKGALKWVSTDDGAVIFEMLCVGEMLDVTTLNTKEEPVEENAEKRKAAPVEKPEKAEQTVLTQQKRIAKQAEVRFPKLEVLAAKPEVVPAQPRVPMCVKRQPHYLRPATPGMTRQIASVTTRAFTNGGRLPGQGPCGNYCVSRLSTTNLSAIDIAKTQTLSRLL